jgi:ATP-dependent exoDNAse (exonuclease V) beta subunit
MSLQDKAARERIRSSLDETLIVEAAAGTGKTTALVSRIVEVVASGRGELGGIVAVTFTEKAAGELKLRLRGELEKARRTATAEVHDRLNRALEQLEQARVGTIHGFCADLLKERPLEAGVDPLFEVATEDEALRIYRRAFDRWLEEKVAAPPPGVRRLLRQSVDWEQQGPLDRLFEAGWELADRRDFPALWEIRPFDREQEIDALVLRVLSLADRSARAYDRRDFLYQDLAPFRGLADQVRAQKEISGNLDYDWLEQRLPDIARGARRKGRGPYGENVSREALIVERDALSADLKAFKDRANADLAAHLQHELPELIERYQALKTRAGRLDFLDLLLLTRNLLLHHPALRGELQERFTHIFIDEFQDTDPLQAEILLLLAAADPGSDDWRRARPKPGKLFIVADPKQSIYRFRRADVALYEQIKRQLLSAGAELVHLTVSFRAVPELQEMVNAAMKDVMTGSAEAHQAAYVPLHRQREPIGSQPALIALPIPKPYNDWGRITFWAIDESEPVAVADWVRWLLKESGWKVTTRDGGDPRPVRASDVCLLFRRFVAGNRDVTRRYVEALQARDIPHVLVGGRGFHLREEIEAMRTALTAIERPDDELSVFATLRGPLFALTSESLFLFRHRHGSLHPLRKLPETLEADDAQVAAALAVLARLHKNRNYHPTASTVRQLLDQTRAHAGFAFWQAGDQVLANVLRLVQLARNFDASGGISFRGFVEHLEELAERGETTEQPLIEEGVEGVRLMTVHRAKGLEFPVVVLCDITCRKGDRPARHVDPEKRLFAIRLAGGAPWELVDRAETESQREAAESERLLYVAATRARDILVVPAVADSVQAGSWVASLYPALYPPSKRQHLSEVAAGCPRFGEDTVLYRPADAEVPPGQRIRPGLHRPRQGAHKVVWWDPAVLSLEPPPRPGLRRHEILHEAEGSSPTPLHDLWSERRRALLEAGAVPLTNVVTATTRAETPLATTAQVSVELVERVAHRPVGKPFGILVHELLSRSKLDAGRSELTALARSLARVFHNTDEELAAAVEAAARALAHPLLRRAAAAAGAGLCHREAPIAYRHPEGTLIEGVMDLAFRDTAEAAWTVVDFKTDVRPDIGQEVYRRQVAFYADALREATGREASAVLLYV